MRASNSGALSGHARGIIAVAIVAVIAIVAGALFAMSNPSRTVLPLSVAPRVSTVPATAPGPPGRITAAAINR